MKKFYNPVLILLSLIITSLNTVNSISIYSGQCVCYRISWVGNNKELFQPIFHQFAKVIVNSNAKILTFYFNGEMVVGGQITYEKANNSEGVEDYVVNGGLQTCRQSIAEKKFTIDIPKRKSDGKDIIGYNFVLQPYNEDSM